MALGVWSELQQHKAGNSLCESENTNPQTTSPLTHHILCVCVCVCAPAFLCASTEMHKQSCAHHEGAEMKNNNCISVVREKQMMGEKKPCLIFQVSLALILPLARLSLPATLLCSALSVVRTKTTWDKCSCELCGWRHFVRTLVLIPHVHPNKWPTNVGYMYGVLHSSVSLEMWP